MYHSNRFIQDLEDIFIRDLDSYLKYMFKHTFLIKIQYLLSIFQNFKLKKLI